MLHNFIDRAVSPYFTKDNAIRGILGEILLLFVIMNSKWRGAKCARFKYLRGITMFRFAKYFTKKEWVFLGILVLINIGQAFLDLTLPDYMGDIVNLVLAHSAMSEVWAKGLMMLLIAFGSISCLIVGNLIASKISADYTKRMRARVFDKVQSFSQGTMNKFTTASLITRSTNDITQIGMAITMTLKVAIYAPVVAIFALVKVVGKSGELSIATGVSVFALVALIACVMIFAVPRFKKIQKLTDQVNGINRENLNGLRVVRAYNAENYQKDKFEVANDSLMRNNSVVGKLTSALSPIMTLVMNGLNLAIVWLGAYLVNDATLDVATLTAFTMYAMQIIMAFLLVSVIFVMIPRATVCLKRVYEVLDAEETITDGKGVYASASGENDNTDVQNVVSSAKTTNESATVAGGEQSRVAETAGAAAATPSGDINTAAAQNGEKGGVATQNSVAQSTSATVSESQSAAQTAVAAQNEQLKGTIQFKNVSFRYPDAEEYVLKNMNFSCERGQTIAFIGSTGSGKSTAINLIPRFYDVTEGEVLVDGNNVKDYTLEELHAKMGYVPQRGMLFSGTVRSNVDIAGSGLSDEEIISALKIAQAYDFVEKMGGLDAHIAQNGSNLSGGQKQRLSIARAIAKHPEICIFDDSFSALDYKTDKTLRATLNKEMKETTKVIVAQRIGTLKDADTIIVLDSGETVGMGTHKQLLKTCEVYRQIASSQLSKEEIYDADEDE